MNPSLYAALNKELTLDEAVRYLVYDDATGKPIVKGSTVVGNPTIAIGRDLASRGLSPSEVALMFQNDMNQCQGDLETELPWITALEVNRQVVLYSLYFNMYLGNVAGFLHGWPNFIEQMRTGAYADAANNLETSEPWASEVKLRAIRLANLVRSG